MKRLGLAVAIAAAALAFAACSAGDATQSFDPAQPCGGVARQVMTGAYPDLELRVPTKVGDTDAARHDSGRFCAKETLGSLWDHSITEVQFGGAIFAVGDKGGVQTTVFRAPGLTTDLLAEEYRTGASADSKVTIVSATTQAIAGRNGFRLNLLNGESHQSIVVWPSKDGAVVQVVIVSDVDELVLQDAITALG